MGAGEGAFTVAAFGGINPDFSIGMLSLAGEWRISDAFGVDGNAGLQRRPNGEVDVRDIWLNARWTPVRTDTAVVHVRPGFTIPTGGIGDGFAFTALSTASFDPTLAVDAVLGSTWMVLPSVSIRVPLVRGWDSVRQGVFVRADTRFGRRMGDTVPWLGLSAVHQVEGTAPRASPALTEVAVTAGFVRPIGDRFGWSAQVRVPFVTGPETLPVWTFGTSFRVVLRKKTEARP